ncbi:MAG: CRISPR-associated helicase/endonuclease Cas3 [Xanthomonadaceae bacterium]|nr:CRISPR-associated helicase/endonuclease Cas3 [Xanthomonadaceae bacterium]MDP2184452.1 CRISPR-associated helicase/endonuclease Cas3 [Xanthomonadales bacterium]MDZ4114575.1 CRISPR-associated helicase/endonuclease Cas3 [Xanthomonadaceae bacterium]MDZ4377978.1 CRISPR-associated helicase/endonuclease Cas3 [Xanthomonadaceae bacterium]
MGEHPTENPPHRDPNWPACSYWGKADPKYLGTPKWHPLPYHALDVAAVAASWWDSCPALRGRFLAAMVSAPEQAAQLRAWILFFVALHDLGKLDLRFQLKAPEALAAAWREIVKDRDHAIPQQEISTFDHGHAGIAWAALEYKTWLAASDADHSIWSRWDNWLAAVTGHHGDFPKPCYEGLDGIEADVELIEHDRAARHAFVTALEDLFLKPAGLSLQELPPACSLPARALLAGFCASCDWLGSNTDEFKYRAPEAELGDYLHERLTRIESNQMLVRYGLLASAQAYAGLPALLASDEAPRGVQTQIDALPAAPGLTLIEAPTGSGKTEAALAYAWRLLAAGVADSIVFALPTQATANAMLERVEAFAAKVYGHANIVLAHGKRDFNAGFQQLVERGQRRTRQGDEEASVQCAAWLANSRKRVFLGQIGVCTVDQVLLSVLPVRHKFVRGFGLNKSVLIVDEVHAYDAYMYGLLGEVLKNQHACGGSAVLLSATLSAELRGKLLAAWGAHAADEADAPYPALWHATGGETSPATVADEQKPPRREVGVECLRLPNAVPDDTLLTRIVAAAENGALVAVVVNLVDDAQRLARALRDLTSIEVDIFHARYRFTDRQEKEDAVRDHYGRKAPRTTGRILVATQVVEQSLDLDFDWLITQICPVDLLFQRLGRLHRHQRAQRPPGFETPRCTVLTVEGDDYGVFELIYGNARVLWRTDALLNRHNTLVFPEAYRVWIEQVYQRDDWDDEPKKIALDYDAYRCLQISRDKDAQQLTTMTTRTFRDEDDRITGLTRDGEMSLSVLPLTADGSLIDGRRIEAIPERECAESLNLNAVPAPASWAKRLRDCRMDTEGMLAGALQLVVSEDSPGVWHSHVNNFTYTRDFGLEKACHESA